jgi:hypothetical protein
MFRPQHGDVISKSQKLHIYNSIQTEYDILRVDIELYDMTSRAMQTWSVPNPSRSRFMLVNERLSIDPAMPVGKDYRVSVNAIAATPTSFMYGYSTPVELVP